MPVSKQTHRIQSMFGAIAPVYDALNHVFSLNIDKIWRRFAVRSALKPTDRHILDVACGTGDLTEALRQAASPSALVLGSDFCEPMLRRAARKGPGPYVLGDGLHLPFPDGSFDLVTIGFGLRNMENYRDGLSEMRRVLKPGGRLAVLDFTTPRNILVRTAYLLYFQHFLPAIGRLVSGSDAYRYLSRSVLEWPDPRELARDMKRCGFARVRHAELSFGIAVLHIAEVTQPEERG
ncbi:MAG: demethylmenaquinone methyltransferase / 2-methoxy-6-polyprenyl,4-benzoquinol methylase [Candidatus Sumerlaeota bacterium]|nr:demethylmenaquinone methyltransferase / 2-methoxy-6-polyprenyl,4-benzoquinol methylase [Candidatus Sumerlaeota bacterium]